MKVADVDFPDPLIAAIRDRELVVFAGAGVSMGEPAGLPGFAELADQIAAHTGRTRDEDEAIDVFLGRLQRDGTGVNVHGRAVGAVSGESGKVPKPTDLHRGLLRLYRRSDEVRLVTTNFDELFERAASEVLDGLPEVFCAPALPLGGDFAGIVHLHGSVRDPKRMVLTDRDFGRAYLTQDWARRFVLDLFQTKTVLFVGYGHADVVLNYLARALPPVEKTKRFALVGSLEHGGDSSRWHRLGVEPVLHPQVTEEDYDSIPVAVHALADIVHRGALAWRRTIRDIAAVSPPVDQESSDLIAFALERPENVRFFTESAESAEWVGWLERRGFLDGLFDDTKYREREHELGRWLLRRFASDDAVALFEFIGSRSNRLATGFWQMVAMRLNGRDTDEVEHDALCRWVSLLVVNLPRVEPQMGWVHSLAEVCARHSLWDELLDVFSFCSARYVASLHVVQSHDVLGVSDVERFWLNDLWTSSVRPHLGCFAEALLDRAADCFERRRRLLALWRPDLKGLDWSVVERVAIEAQDDGGRTREPVDVLLDAARDSLDWLAEHTERAASNWCARNVRSGSAALRRLAVHGILSRGSMSADDRIDWLLGHVDLYELALKHEVCRVARKSYPRATDGRRKRFVERILDFKGRASDRTGADWAEGVDYEKFNWLVLLQEAAPACPWVKKSLRVIRQHHPDLERLRESDRAVGRMEPHWVASKSERTTDELLSLSPEQWVAGLPAELPDEELCPDGRRVDHAEGLALEIGRAAEREPRWGLDLANALVAAGRVEEKFWPDLLRALGAAGGGVLTEVLGLFTRAELRAAHLWERAEVLRGALAERNPDWVGKCFPRVLATAATLSEEARSVELNDEAELRRRGWRHAGFHHPAFPLATVWLNALDVLREDGGSSWGAGERELVVDALSACVAEDSDFTAVSVSVLAGHVHFLLAVEEGWTRTNLLPLFDAGAATSDGATLHGAAWDGFLVQGRLSPAIAEALQPAFLSLTASVGEFSDWKRKRFLHYVATIMVHYVDNPLDEWIPRLFDGLDEDGRVRFARRVGLCLGHACSEVQLECWHRWLKQYWSNRVDRVPSPLTEGETAAMFHWLSNLRPVFPEAVDLAVRMPAFSRQRVELQLSKLGDKYAGTDHVPALAKLALHLSDHDLGLDTRGLQRLTDRLLGEDLPRETKRRLKAAAATLGRES